MTGLFCNVGRCTKAGARTWQCHFFEKNAALVRRLCYKTGHFHQKIARLPFFKLIRAFRFASLRTSQKRHFGRFCRFSPWRLFQRAVSPLPRNGPVLLPRKRQKWPKNHPPSLEPPQLGFLGNFLGLLRVTECHRAHGHKKSVDIFMRVSAPARNGPGVQRRQVHHKNRRR